MTSRAQKPGGHYALFHEGRLNPNLGDPNGLSATSSTLRLPSTSKRYMSTRGVEAVKFGGAYGRKLWRF